MTSSVIVKGRAGTASAMMDRDRDDRDDLFVYEMESYEMHGPKVEAERDQLDDSPRPGESMIDVAKVSF